MVDITADSAPTHRSSKAAAMKRLRETRKRNGIEEGKMLLTREQKGLIRRVAAALGKDEQEVAGMLAAQAARAMLERVAQLEFGLAS